MQTLSFLLISPIRFFRNHIASTFLWLYLWALFPKDFNHEHFFANDYFHTPSEHCENVIYNVAVSDEHKCEHHTHIHTTPAHCFACDNHCTSEHTAPPITYLLVELSAPLPEYQHTLSFQENILQELFNKGPPATTSLLV